MATFCNQSSNLSALSSALSSLSQVLDVSEDNLSSLTIEEHETNASDFLAAQQHRAARIDDSLLQATEHILPPSAEAKTVTELAEVCRLVQESTRQKISLLRTRLECMGVKASWKDSVIVSPKPVFTTKNSAIEWSVGAPLDCVMEGDVETEGATTPGSLLHPSPFASASKQPQRKTSLTPTTPTMNKFSFSTSTASILERMNRPTPSSSAKRRQHSGRAVAGNSTPSPLNLSDRQLNFDGFQDEDDMISLNTTLEAQIMTQQHQQNSSVGFKSPIEKMKEERSQFLKRMESMLERVEEDLIHESRPSDEVSRVSTSKSKPVKTMSRSVKSRPSDEQTIHSEASSRASETGKTRIDRPSNNKFLDELEHVEDTSSSGTTEIDDDSTKMATLVAEAKPQPMGLNIQRPVPVKSRRPTQITVNHSMPSPAHTNITMDNLDTSTTMMMNDTMISMLQDEHDDNRSTATPILDRYGLVPDDNSIGVKVVPNQRGRGGMHQHRHITPPLMDASSNNSNDCQFYEDADGFRSPRGLPGTVSARKTKQYRKTPYPKKQLEESFDDENRPNTRAIAFSPVSASSFSVPPLRPRSFGPRRMEHQVENSRSQSLPTSSVLGLPKTPPAPIGPPRTEQQMMEKITMAEYNSAPRVVQMQVSREEANQAIDILMDYLRFKGTNEREFAEEEGYRALSNLLATETKRKSALISLCHWKRLLMHRRGDSNGHPTTIFEVNSFQEV